MIDKIDKKLLELVYEVSELTNETKVDKDKWIEPILIGGRALNMQLANERTSQDSDFILRMNGNPTTKSQLRKFAKSVKDLINEEFDKNLKRAENNSVHIEFAANKLDHYVEYPFMIRIVIYINDNEYKLEISTDVTAKEFTFDIFDDKFKVLSVENILALKTVISAKRIDEGTINDADNIRHIYDLYRILLEKDDLNNKRLDVLIENIHNYEITRKQEKGYEYQIEIDDIKRIIVEYVNANSLEIIDSIEFAFGIENIDKDNFVNIIAKLIK